MCIYNAEKNAFVQQIGQDVSNFSYRCSKGKEHAIQEFKCPKRILTTTIKTTDTNQPLLPIRSSEPIPKKILSECMVLLASKKVNPPIKVDDVIVKNILNTGVDIIATQNLPYDQ
jgi:CxxC motif-containing protein